MWGSKGRRQQQQQQGGKQKQSKARLPFVRADA